MHYRMLLSVLVFGMIVCSSCDKDDDVIPQPPPQNPPAVLLKEITIPNLPSPYYHFEYTDSGMIDKALYASGLRSYDVIYSGTKIAEMKSTHIINKDRLKYVYDNGGKIAVIEYNNEDGTVYKRAFLAFQGNQLQNMEWERKENAGFAVERTLSFVYQSDGNVLEMTDHRHPVSGQDEATYVSRYEQYDTKLNVDGFSLVHENNDHLLLLPGVVFQKNNPSKLIFTGTGANYTIDYTYTYNDKNAPLTKLGDAVFTAGPNTGQKFKTSESFSYY